MMAEVSASIDLHAEFPHVPRLAFDKREIRQALRKGGTVVQKEARRLISRRAVSKAGEFPGYDSGAMSRSIKIKVGSRGGYVKVMPQLTAEMGKRYYPAFLAYGVPKHNLKPRKNFMTAALDNRSAEVRAAIVRALQHSLSAS